VGGLWMVVYRPKWYLRDRNGMGGLLVQAQVRYLPRSPTRRAEACGGSHYLGASFFCSDTKRFFQNNKKKK